MDDSRRGHEAMNTEFEGCTALEADALQRLAKTQHSEKS
jgi:hypothetical protein